MHIRYLILFFILVIACKEEPKEDLIEKKPTEYLLTQVSSSQTNIHFVNTVKETFEENYLNYEFLYNGSGVALGDLNNDGLIDIYFGGNSSDDKLYINEGDFKFKDISTNLGVDNLKGWTTGVNFVDINADGLLDIYVCRSGPSKNPDDKTNKLFINQGDLIFIESAKFYNINKNTQSIQSAFFDYDLDGDLDMYLLNHPTIGFKPAEFKKHVSDVINGKLQTDFFFENIDGKFIDKTKEAGLVNFGYRHGIAVGDVNNDYYPDLYISSDFEEPDLFYLNTTNKSFKNVTDTHLKHISFNSMGNEIVDINNDGLLDIFVVDMAPSNHFRSKVYMKSMNTAKFNALSESGFHFQYMQNTLHINNGNNTYSEIAQLSGIGKTDWSWAPLFFDMDLDGKKDLFVSNGIKENFLYRDIMSEVEKKQKLLNRQLRLEELLEIVPTDISPNNAYQNIGNFKFKDVSSSWVMNNTVNTNGAAYGDLDNDGDLDLVLNNMDAEAGIYKNITNLDKANFIKIKLNGNPKNTFAIGAKVVVTTNSETQIQELHNARGYLSSVSHELLFGTGNNDEISNIKVIWNSKRVTELNNIKTNQTLVLNYDNSTELEDSSLNKKDLFQEVAPNKLNIEYIHRENKFNDYSKQTLLPQKQSTQGPCMSVSDVNGDKLEDFFVGGGPGQSGKLYIQNTNGTFRNIQNSDFIRDKNYEDVESLFFDSDNDGDLDLYVSSSGYELTEDNNLLQDRLYTNDGKGNFKRSNNLPPMLSSTKAVKSFDYDSDGDLDLIIGGRVIPGKYPLAPQSYILENNQGVFTNVTQDIAPDFERIGMITDIEITDYNNDNKLEFMIVGQWMPITLFSFENEKFVKTIIPEFDKTEGWYYALSSEDFDNDGDMDYVLGNLGLNNKFHPSLDKPLHIFSNNFDKNKSYDIALSKEYKGELVPVRGKECSSEQTPYLNEKIGTYKEFASLNIEGIYGAETIENSNHLTAYNFKSVYLENQGDGHFKLHYLPNEAQMSPTLDFEIADVNNDGFKDIIGVGNLYDAEVETVRYDASQGYVLLGNGNHEFEPLIGSGFICNKDMRSINILNIGGKDHFFITSNNNTLSVFKLEN